MQKKFLCVLLVIVLWLNNLQAQNTDLASQTAGRSNGTNEYIYKEGEFITIRGEDGIQSRAYAAGPTNAEAGILVVHDYFGITGATKEFVERLGSLGYRAIAVDLYKGKSAGNNDSAEILMNAKTRKETDLILRSGIDYLKKPGRKLATIGFSAGGVDAMNANLMDPESINATVVVYGGGYDTIAKSRIEKLRSPVLAITGSKDEWPVQAALHFFAAEKDKSFELFIYPNAYHAYAQPLFLNGKNYDAEATRVSWKLMDDFLSRHLNDHN